MSETLLQNIAKLQESVLTKQYQQSVLHCQDIEMEVRFKFLSLFSFPKFRPYI
jgi:hypothetical protein